MHDRAHFRTLRRTFLRRFMEHEFLSSSGDLRDLLSNLIAVLAALGICISLMLLQKHVTGQQRVPPELRAAVAWSDQEFLMSMTIAVAGVFVILCWDALFPDRTDCLVLAALPVRLWTVLAAKLTAVCAVFGLLVGAANAVPLLAVPPIMLKAGGGAGLHRYFIAQLIATAAASLFILAFAAAVQGVLINILSYRWFQRVSAWAQLAAIFVLLALFFATPDVATPDRLADPANRWTITLLPSFWFLGLCQAILGTTHPAALWLAKLALSALAGSLAVAAVSYGTGYARYVRSAIEDAGIEPARRRGRGIVRRIVNRLLVRTPEEQAVFHFVRRTMMRSRTHRLVFAAYMSLGLIYLAMGTIPFFERHGNDIARPDAATGGIPLVLAFFALVGMRAMFSIPVDLRANWLFRLTEQATPAAALGAVRKLMFVSSVLPAAAFALAAYSALWGFATGVRFSVIVLLILMLALERLMRDFRKIPFTCSYLPGKSNLKLMVAIYVVFFMVFALAITSLAVGAAGDFWRFGELALVCAAWLAWKVWRRRSGGASTLVYEEKPDWQPLSLELT